MDNQHEEWIGFCPVCDQKTTFVTENPKAYRDFLFCGCGERTIPRERAMMLMLNRLAPDWRQRSIHECSPGLSRGPSKLIQAQCPGYLPTQFFPDVPLGTMHTGFRNEDLGQQTFADNSFDIVITQDVYEHLGRVLINSARCPLRTESDRILRCRI